MSEVPVRLLLPVLIAACGTPEGDAPVDLRAELEAPGPYAVGHTVIEVSYRPPGRTEDRVLPVEVWYPAPAGAEGEPASYLIAGTVPLASEVALSGVPVAEGPFPVAVYSHGSGGVGMLAWPYAERLAARGWVVLSADHLGNSSLDVFLGSPSSFERNSLERPLDVRALLDAAEAGLPGPVGSQGDVSRSLVWGHSFGGYTTLAVGGARLDVDVLSSFCSTDCALFEDPAVIAAFEGGQADPRVSAIVPQAPALVGLMTDASLPAISVPVQVQSAARDVTTPDEEEARPLWRALDGEADRWVRLPEGGHYSYITICEDLGIDVIDVFQPGSEDDGCGPSNTPVREAVAAMGTYLLAHAEVHVLGNTDYTEVIDGPPLHPEVQVER